MANQACGVQAVDYAVFNEVLIKGTGNRSARWDRVAMNWHRMTFLFHWPSLKEVPSRKA